MDDLELRVTTSIKGNDNNDDSSDLLSMLKVIEHLYAVTRLVMNRYATVAVLQAMAAEAQTLLVKLKLMHRRWKIHLPFKEAGSVDFIDWSSRMAQLAKVIRTADGRRLPTIHTMPSNHYLLDLYDQASCDTDEVSVGESDFGETDPRQLLLRQASLQETLMCQRELCVDKISQYTASRLSAREGLDMSRMADFSIVSQSCSTLLTELSEELTGLHEQLVKIFTSEEYERLADRILEEAEYSGQTARREARDIMHNWRNAVPPGQLEENRRAQIEQTKEEIRHSKYGVKLEQYVNLDGDFFTQRSEFGQFLFNRRRDITRSELYQLMRLLYCIYYYQKDAQKEAVPGGKVTLPAEFDQSLRENEPAVMLFMKILGQVEPYINKGGAVNSDGASSEMLFYKDWTWCYLRDALEEMEIWSKHGSAAAFARFINLQFPHRTEDSVKRALYRNTNVNSRGIVSDIIGKFEPVRSLITK